MGEDKPAVSSIISTVLIILIVISVASVTSFIVFQLVDEEKTSQAGFVIDEDENTGIITVQYVSSGNSDYVRMEAEHFNYKFEEVGEKIHFAGQNLNFIGINDGYETLFKTYEPGEEITDKVIIPAEFEPVFIEQDDKYSSVDFQFTNPYEEEIHVESIRIDALEKQTTLSHLSNDEEIRPDKCPGEDPSPEPLCTLVYIEGSSDGWVEENAMRELPILIGNTENFNFDDSSIREGDVLDEEWNEAALEAGDTMESSFYRFQPSRSGNQVSDIKEEVVFVTVYFSNGEVITYSDTIKID